MNKDTWEGQWKQVRGAVKESFGKLTDDDLLQAEGSADKMLGVLQTRYGYTKAEAQQEWAQFLDKYGKRTAAAQADLNAAARDAQAARR